MALPKKGTRSLTVDGVAYRWAVRGDDDGIGLVVELADAPGQQLVANFRYRDYIGPHGPDGRLFRGQRRTVGPGAARQLILAALARGWRPAEGGLPTFAVPDAEQVVPVAGV